MKSHFAPRSCSLLCAPNSVHHAFNPLLFTEHTLLLTICAYGLSTYVLEGKVRILLHDCRLRF